MPGGLTDTQKRWLSTISNLYMGIYLTLPKLPDIVLPEHDASWALAGEVPNLVLDFRGKLAKSVEVHVLGGLSLDGHDLHRWWLSMPE